MLMLPPIPIDYITAQIRNIGTKSVLSKTSKFIAQNLSNKLQYEIIIFVKLFMLYYIYFKPCLYIAAKYQQNKAQSIKI